MNSDLHQLRICCLDANSRGSTNNTTINRLQAKDVGMYEHLKAQGEVND
jgi:hypothetical protein